LSLFISGTECSSLHFTGMLGSGMSAIAQYCRLSGLTVTGSDRLAESIDTKEIKKKLEKLGCVFFPQDGSGISEKTSAIVVSTAVEEDNRDIKAARGLGIPVFHRSDVLAALVETKRTVAIAGTSGKSTVAAMVFEFLTFCGKSPSLIAGANLVRLEEEGLVGNAFLGNSDILVIEADESDGSLVKYKPEVSVFLNISKDHKPQDEVMRLFETLADRSTYVIANANDQGLKLPGISTTFGTSILARYKPERIDTITPFVAFFRSGTLFELPLPGYHNLLNVLAALCVCDYFGCPDFRLAEAVGRFKGLRRRFSISTLPGGITVVDDFAHNPEKVKAAMTTAKAMSRRVFAVFQPHGFGPTRFLKDDYVKVFSEVLTNNDELYLLPIYYAGGTARIDISASDLAQGIARGSKTVFTPPDRAACIGMLREKTAPGDMVLVMGARDPSLPGFVSDIVKALSRGQR
jgi:UDP-N-acetylmuramate--alanine ligase